MAIEFPCARCGQQVRTPDSAAGKKGKCPGCGQVQQIPFGEPPTAGASDPTTPHSSAGREPRSTRPAAERGAEQIDAPQSASPALPAPLPPLPFEKPQIKSKLAELQLGRADLNRPAKRSSLPTLIADGEQADDDAGTLVTHNRPTSAGDGPPPIAVQLKLEFACPSCGQLNRTSAETAGKKGRCPHCKAVMQIPAIAPPSETRPTSVDDRLAPTSLDRPGSLTERTKPGASSKFERGALSEAGSKSKPLELAPESFIPAPKPAPPTKPTAEEPQPQRLTPLTPIPSLTPVDSSSSEIPLLIPVAATPEIPTLTALGPEPDLPELTPLGPAALLPVLAPVGAVQPHTPGGAVAGWNPPPLTLHRPGLAWERRPSAGSFFETAWEVAFKPAVAFRQMWQSGGLGLAIGFGASLQIFVAVVSAFFAVFFVVAMMALSLQNAHGPRPPAELQMVNDAFPTLLARQLAKNLGFAVFQLTVSALFTAGGTHGLMVLFGQARAEFLATFRVFLYCMGSTALFQLIPCCGIWIASLWTFIILMIGVAQVHQSQPFPAIAAVFVSVSAYYGLILLVAALVFGTLFYSTMQGL
jgi:phage FluMu protein Com